MLERFVPGLAALAILVLFPPNSAYAAVRTYDFTVTVDPSSNVPGTSTEISGSVTFDDSVADLLPGDSNIGVYIQSAGSSITLSSGSFFYSAQLFDVEVFRINQNVLFVADSVPRGFSGIEIFLNLDAFPTGSHAVSSDAIPAEFDLMQFVGSINYSEYSAPGGSDQDRIATLGGMLTCLSSTGACTSQPEVLTCVGFESPLADGPVKLKKNRTLPHKARLYAEDGVEATDSDVITAAPYLQVLFTAVGSTEAIDVSTNAETSGAATSGNQFQFIDGQWRYNLSMKNFTAQGTYQTQMLSADPSQYVINPACQAAFVVE